MKRTALKLLDLEWFILVACMVINVLIGKVIEDEWND